MMEKEQKTALREVGIKGAGIKEWLRFACHIGVYLFLFVLMVCYSFYLPEGRNWIVTNKFHFFQKMCQITFMVMAPLIYLFCLLSVKEFGRDWRKECGKILQKFSITDIFVLFFALANTISYLSTDFPEEALWGTVSWYLGFVINMFFVGIYFLISRFYEGRPDEGVLSFFMAVTSVIFLWGILERFSVYPVDMQYDNVEFISCIGNIDWFCGFWSIFFCIGIVLYLMTGKVWLRVFSGIYMVISLGAGVMAGADSAFISIGTVFFFAFLISFQKTAYMKRLLETGLSFCLTCQILRLITVFWPDRLNLHSFLMDLMLGNFTFIIMMILLLIYFLMIQKDKNTKPGKKVGAVRLEKEWINNYIWIKRAVVGVVCCLFFLYIVLIVLNTKNPGSIGILSDYPGVFFFDGNWGSTRGATWMDGLAIFRSIQTEKKLFGVGPDCYSAYAYSIPKLEQRLHDEWGWIGYTNAHNECITYLVNIGILGAGMFIGIFVSSFIRLVKSARQEPLCYVFAASLLSYFLHNQFSFTQLESTPYMFMMLGLGENLLQRCEDKN